MDINGISDAIDKADLAVANEKSRIQSKIDSNRANEQNRMQNIKKQITSVYKKHNRSKLSEIDGLMSKYKGKEEDLLRAIKDKYSLRQNGKWQYILKNYDMKNKFTNWNIDESLIGIKTVLDELASSIGGECHQYVDNKGQRKLIVREALKKNTKFEYNGGGSRNTHDWDTVKPTVEKMRKVIHDRYNYTRNHKSKSHLLINELDKRKEEKRFDQLRKNKRR